MNITFINPCLGGDFSALDIAITALATYVNKNTEHSANIIDLTFHRRNWHKFLRTEIIRKEPDIIGISTTSVYMEYVKKIMREIKKEFNLPIIAGGYHASIYPEHTIGIAECDIVCIGDGEKPVEELLNYYSKYKSISGIRFPGIWTKEEGGIVKNSRGHFRTNIDDLPIPDWDLWDDLDKYFYFLGMLYLIGSRGCPYKCSFCDAHGIAASVDGQYFRMRDPRKYVEEIEIQWEKYKDKNLRLLQLFDPVFTMNQRWVEDFCNEYIKHGLHNKIKFSVFSRIDHLNEQKIKLLSAAGCGVIRVGVETGDKHMRERVYKKNIDNMKIRNIFKLLHDNGIAITSYYMLGGPGESHRTLNKTLKFAVELNAERTAFFIYKPFTKEGKKQVYEYGGRIHRKRLHKADNISFKAVIYTKDLSPLQVELAQLKSYFIIFLKRLCRILRKKKYKYFRELYSYLYNGIKNGLSLAYLFMYFHIYGYDNIDK